MGQELGERFPEPGPLLPAATTLTFAVLGLWLGTNAGRALYGARELVLLHANGLQLRDVVLLRGVETLLLSAVLALPMTACQAGVVVARGAEASSVSALAWLGASLALTGAALCGAWLAGRAPWGPRALSLVGLGAAGAIAAVLSAPELAAALGAPLSPGSLWQAAAYGSLPTAAAIAGGGLLWTLLGLGLAGVGYGAATDRAATRSTANRRTLWQVLALPARPLGRAAGALLRRDLVILLRGGFRRGLILLVVLPASLLVLRAIVGDASLSLAVWQVQWAGLLVAGILASAAGYLFGLDYPRARDAQRILERSQPLRGRQVMLSRWAPALAYAVALAAAAAWIVGQAPKGPDPAWFFLAALLQALAVTHDAAAFGLGAESSQAVDQAAGFPFRSGILVLVISFALSWHPLGILVYPLLGYVHAGNAALRRWEAAEVVPLSREGGA
jgi:hypothetical protein